MALEELIVAWSKERPAWQREVMRRVAAGDVLSDDDYDRLVDDILAGRRHSPRPSSDSSSSRRRRLTTSPVCLVAIESPNT